MCRTDNPAAEGLPIDRALEAIVPAAGLLIVRAAVLAKVATGPVAQAIDQAA